MKSRMAGVLNLWFSIFKEFLLSAPFFRGLRRLDFRKIGEKSFTKLWALDCWFSRTNDQRLFAFKKGTEIGGMIVCFGLCPCQHNGTYTRNVYPAIPTKKPAQILRFAEGKKEPLSRKILGKTAQNAVGKGEPHPVKRTEKKYKVFPVSSRALLAVFYAARQSACFSIGVSTPRLR